MNCGSLAHSLPLKIDLQLCDTLHHTRSAWRELVGQL